MEHQSAQTIRWVASPAENFTGEVKFGELSKHGPLNALAVHFSPGARTYWHSHPEGQVLYVTEGAGLVQDRDGTTVEIAAGDTVFAPAGQLHWHGARPDSAMTHLSLTTGGATEWTAVAVTDDEYNSR